MSHRDSQLLVSMATEKPYIPVSVGYYGKPGCTKCTGVKDLMWKVHRQMARALLPSLWADSGVGVHTACLSEATENQSLQSLVSSLLRKYTQQSTRPHTASRPLTPTLRTPEPTGCRSLPISKPFPAFQTSQRDVAQHFPLEGALVGLPCA